MVDDLVEFLRARYDEREQKALAAGGRGPAGQWRAPDDLWAGRVEDADGNIVVHDEGSPTEAQAAHIADNDPADTLADLDAKRRILDGHPFEQGIVGGVCGTCHGAGRLDVHWDGEEETLEHVDTEMVWPCPTVRLLALPFARHPDYRDEWKP